MRVRNANGVKKRKDVMSNSNVTSESSMHHLQLATEVISAPP